MVYLFWGRCAAERLRRCLGRPDRTRGCPSSVRGW